MKMNPSLAKRLIRKAQDDGLDAAIKSGYKYAQKNWLPVEQKWKMYELKERITGHPGVGDPLRVYRVDPQKIQYIYAGESVGFISPGNWDIKGKKQVDGWFFTKMLTKRFEHDVPWKEISEYQIMEDKIQQRGYVYMMDIPKEEQSVEKLYEYYMYIDDLYNKIKNEGYKSQREIDTEDDFAKRDKHPALNEIQVRISRDGVIMPHSGYHRFTICKILGIESVPVRTSSRHLQWQKIRDDIYQSRSKSELTPDIQTYVDHPELEDITDFS